MGARRLNPPRPHLMSVWDLLRVLSCPAFEQLHVSELRVLSSKTVLLLMLACGNSISINAACMEFRANDCIVRLTPRRGYAFKLLSTPLRAQMITLQAFDSPEMTFGEGSDKCLLCPVHALHAYVDRTSHFCLSEKLFVYFEGFGAEAFTLDSGSDMPGLCLPGSRLSYRCSCPLHKGIGCVLGLV